MVTVYSKEYLEKYEVISRCFKERRERDKLARELRKKGFKTNTSTSHSPFNGPDLYCLEAEKKRR